MSRIHVLSVSCFAGLVLSGCGPLPNPPLPARVDDETQKSINASWEKALSPVDRFDQQSLLDVLLTTYAYHHGVDKLEFRSEKTFSGGVVVMEVHFDRAEPDRDCFTVTVKDRQGKVRRRERYDRNQIETTARELTSDLATLRKARPGNRNAGRTPKARRSRNPSGAGRIRLAQSRGRQRPKRKRTTATQEVVS